MRWTLALCVVVGCAMCGSAMSGARHRRIRLLESVVQGLKLLRLHMISMFEPVQQALAASDSDLLAAVGASMGPGVSAGEAWVRIKRAEYRRGGRIDALSPRDIRALDALFRELGESGRDRQDILLNSAQEALSRELDDAREHASETDRLYVSLGALTGLMIALIVI